MNLRKYITLAAIERAVASDTDPASCFILGSDFVQSDGAVIVVKGADAALRVYNLLTSHGLLTPGKEIETK